MEKIKCKVCGTEVDAKVIGENHYIAREEKLNILTGEKTEYLYDAFDCTICKCQNILGERYKKYITLISENTPDEVVFVEKEKRPNCFGHYNESSVDCRDCKSSKDCEEEYEKKYKLKMPWCFANPKDNDVCKECNCLIKCGIAKKQGCYGKYTEKNIVCVEKCELKDLCKYYTTGKTDGK